MRPLQTSRSWAWLDACVAKNNFKAKATQKSVLTHLEAGKKYYFEAFQRDGTGSDYLQIAWGLTLRPRRSSAARRWECSTVMIQPAPDAPGKPTMLPVSSQVVRLNWNAVKDASGVYEYRIYRNGTLLCRQSSNVLAITLADNLGAQYSVECGGLFRQ